MTVGFPVLCFCGVCVFMCVYVCVSSGVFVCICLSLCVCACESSGVCVSVFKFISLLSTACVCDK